MMILFCFPRLHILFFLSFLSSVCPFNGERVFVLAHQKESPAQTCHRCGLSLTSPSHTNESASWSMEVLLRAVLAVNQSLSSKPVQGCCVSGLWCRSPSGHFPGECFTQSLLEPFVNFGFLPNDETSLPVYACYRRSSPLSTLPLNITHTLNHSTLSLVLLSDKMSRISEDESVALTVDSRSCPRVDRCSPTCQSCEESTDCPLGSMCLGDGHHSFCFLYCGGRYDASCPCGQTCHPLAVMTRTGHTVLHACAPYPFSFANSLRQGACRGCADTVQIQCHSVFSGQTNGSFTSVDISVGLTAPQSTILDSFSNMIWVPNQCSKAEDCFDNDICTVDACVENQCFHSVLETPCRSAATNPHLGVVNPNTYATIKYTNMDDEQRGFSLLLLERGIVSHDSYSKELEEISDLGFSFFFFGNRVTSLAINPRGFLQLSPILPCSDTTISIEVSNNCTHYC